MSAIAEAIDAGTLPGRVWMYADYHCNLACTYCLTESAPGVAKRLLEPEEMIRIAREAAELGYRDIGITGGEPFLLRHLPKTLAAVSEYLPTLVLTNGTLFNETRLTELAPLAQLPVAPTGSCGTYSYYCRPGDYLTIHRDIATCDVAVITCLEEEGIASSGGKLCVYPSRVHESLAQVRRDPTRGALPLRLAPGETVVLFGGLVPHCTLPVVAGQNRVVSLLCYRAIVE